MNPKLMIWVSVILSAVAQICLKYGLNQVSGGARRTGIRSLVLKVACQPFIWVWGLCFVAATGLWLLGLQKLQLSYAYPLVSFGFVLVNLLSVLCFRERVNGTRWISVLVICFGVFLIAGS